MRIGQLALASGPTASGPTASGLTASRLTVKALRNIGLALDTVAEALSNPNQKDSFIERHRAHVADEGARQDADETKGSALIDSLELDYTVHHHYMPTQHWVGIQHEIRNLELDQVE